MNLKLNKCIKHKSITCYLFNFTTVYGLSLLYLQWKYPIMTSDCESVFIFTFSGITLIAWRQQRIGVRNHEVILQNSETLQIWAFFLAIWLLKFFSRTPNAEAKWWCTFQWKASAGKYGILQIQTFVIMECFCWEMFPVVLLTCILSCTFSE